MEFNSHYFFSDFRLTDLIKDVVDSAGIFLKFTFPGIVAIILILQKLCKKQEEEPSREEPSLETLV